MSDDLKDILSNLNKDIEQDKLLQYLSNNLSADEKHLVEKQMNDDEFMNDAVEGLQELKDKDQIPAYVQQINAGLKNQLDKKKKKQLKRKLPGQFWTYITIILVLMLIVIAYVILKRI